MNSSMFHLSRVPNEFQRSLGATLEIIFTECDLGMARKVVEILSNLSQKNVTDTFNPILKFFDIKPTDNFFNDIRELFNADFSHASLQSKIYKAIFDAYDGDSNGSIDSSELRLLLQDIGKATGIEGIANMTDQDVTDVINTLDKDGNGSIEWPEFESFISNLA